MSVLFNIARMGTGTTGTGTITLGAAAQSFLTFAQAGAVDQQVVRYLIEDPPNREVGTGTYTSAGTTLTRTVIKSTNSNNPISLSGVAQVALTALAEDITNKTGDTLTGALNWATAPTIASSSTVNIGAAASNYIIISGTNAITTFDTIAQGAERTLRFQASLTLTNSASLACIGSANIQTANGDVADFISEGSGNWRMLRYQPVSGMALVASGFLPPGFVSVLVSNNGGDANNDIDFAVGKCRDSTDVTDMALAGAITKRLDASWVVGTNQGGLDTGSKAANTFYYLWIIKRTDTGVVDALFSLSATAPTMPTNYDHKQRVGFARTNGSSNILPFKQDVVNPDEFRWTNTSFADLTIVVGQFQNDTSLHTFTCTAPPSSRALIRAIQFADNGGAPGGLPEGGGG
jgi:hypothetical protein